MGLVACPNISETTLGLTFLVSSSVNTRVSEVMEAYQWQPCSLEQGLEAVRGEVAAIQGLS